MLAFDKVVQSAQAVPSSTAELKGLYRVVDQDPDILPSLPTYSALQLFRYKPPRERDHFGIEPTSLRIGVLGTEVGGLYEKAQGVIYRYHLVIVREVGIEGSVQREREG